MKNINLVIIIILFFMECFASDIVRFRVIDYPPQYFKDDNNVWKGIDVELAKAIISEAGFAIELIELPWSRALREIEEGQIDMMANLSITDSRSKYLNWIGPERRTNMVLVVKKENLKIKIDNENDIISQARLLNKRVGVQQDAYYSHELNKMINSNDYEKYFDVVTKSELNFIKLSNNRLLAVIEEQITAVFIIKNNPQYDDLAIHTFPISSENVYFGVSKKVSAEKFDKLNTAFNYLEKKGDLNKIRDKYYKISE